MTVASGKPWYLLKGWDRLGNDLHSFWYHCILRFLLCYSSHICGTSNPKLIEDVAHQLLGLAPTDEPKDETFSHVVNGFWCTVSTIFTQTSSISLSCILTQFSAGITTIARIPYIKAIASKTNFLRKIALFSAI
jgi:hypothetical protein